MTKALARPDQLAPPVPCALLIHSAPDVYAVGDVCCFPLPLDDYALSKLDHVQHARESAAFVAKCMVSGDDAFPAYDPVPYFYSRYLDLAWKFYGISSGEAVVLGLKVREAA